MILRFLLVFFIIYWVGYLLRTYVLKPFKNGHGSQGGASSGNSASREGDVSINYNPTKSQKEQQSVGEYVDYEEIEEDEKDKK
jgi:hypothetical protein